MRDSFARQRMALHDWMWDGGERPNVLRRLARKLPDWFSDPEAVYLKRWTASNDFSLVSQPTMTFCAPQTWTTSNSSNVTITWPLSRDNPYR